MKNYIQIVAAVLIVLCMACRKEELGWKLTRQRAFVKTAFAQDIKSGGFKAMGSADDDGGAPITERGFFISQNSDPTSSDLKFTAGSGSGDFNAEITGLSPDTEYYIRAYAINKFGIWYGEAVKQFTFPGSWPLVETVSATEESMGNVRVKGELQNDGGYPNTQRGICYGTSFIPDTSLFKLNCGSGMGVYDTLISGLSAGDWYFRAYALNEKGLSYGITRKVVVTGPTTSPTVPVVTTRQPSFVSSSAISGGGDIVNDGGAPIQATGLCYSTSPGPDLLTGQVETNVAIFYSFNVTLLGLTDSTTYYIRAYATNSAGTGYGNEIVVTTDNWP